MEAHIILTGITYFALIFMAVVILLWVLYELGKKQKAKDDILEAEYCKLYNEIMAELKDRNIGTKQSDKEHISAKMNVLMSLEWKSKEMTSVMWCEYMRKFYPYEEEMNEHGLDHIDFERAEKRVTAINNFRK
jgi:hypothetical protein